MSGRLALEISIFEDRERLRLRDVKLISRSEMATLLRLIAVGGWFGCGSVEQQQKQVRSANILGEAASLALGNWLARPILVS